LALFHKLGFGIVKTSEVWQEAEMRFGRGEGMVDGAGRWAIEKEKKPVKEIAFQLDV
jgi:hypothetical protein